MDQNAQLKNPKSANQVLHQALISSALESAKAALALGLPENRLILSCKVSQVADLVTIYQALASQSAFPLHLGLTEAGLGDKAVVASAAGLAILLHQGIGETIRISLTPKLDEPRTKEVKIAQELLQSLGLRYFKPSVTACPGCGRTSSSYFQKLAADIEGYIALNLAKWRKQYPQAKHLKIAVMGCIVNGPGESKHADIGISLPGSGEAPSAPVFINGKKTHTLKGDNIGDQFKAIIENYLINYGQ